MLCTNLFQDAVGAAAMAHVGVQVSQGSSQ